MGNIQWGPCGGGKKRRKSGVSRSGSSAVGQRKSDELDTAASTGYGSYGYGGLSTLSYGLDCPEGIDEDLALLATAAAIAASLWVLYRQIVIQTVGRRKRSPRSFDNRNVGNKISFPNPVQVLQNRIKDIKSEYMGSAFREINGIKFLEDSSLGTFIYHGTKQTTFHSVTHLILIILVLGIYSTN